MKNALEFLSQLNTGSQIVDTHCHLDMTAYQGDLKAVLERANNHYISQIVTIGIDLESSKHAVTLSKKYPQIFATIGVHPHDVDHMDDTTYSALSTLYSENERNIVAFGEIGLDYVKNYSPPVIQRVHFKRQLELAQELQLPIVIHNREANEDTLRILRESKPLDQGGIMHCFSGDLAFAKKVIDLGLMISIPGIVTFKNAKTLHEVVRNIPLSELLLETDGPFLAPHPFRGKRNEPAYLIYTAAQIAKLRQTSLQCIVDATTYNARKIFNIPSAK